MATYQDGKHSDGTDSIGGGKKIKVTVSYSVTFEVPTDLISDDVEATQELIKDYANTVIKDEPLMPVITSCDNEEYEE